MRAEVLSLACMPEITQKMSHQRTASDDEYLTKLEVAQRLRKQVRTIDNWMRKGFLPYYKVGRSVTFKWSDVQSHFDANYRVCLRRSV